MSEAQKILQMIETVNPEDAATLDEIDARVKCYTNTTYCQEFLYLVNRNGRYGDGFSYYCEHKGRRELRSERIVTKHTRSRDALKSIRPEGWQVSICEPSTKNDATCELIQVKNKVDNQGYAIQKEHYVSSPTMQNKGFTEELAELHAIIQAIEWERNND